VRPLNYDPRLFAAYNRGVEAARYAYSRQQAYIYRITPKDHSLCRRQLHKMSGDNLTPHGTCRQCRNERDRRNRKLSGLDVITLDDVEPEEAL
jgi:hypothetical protein